MRAAFSKPSRPVLAGALALTVVLVAAACGTGGRVSGGDLAHGRQVFTQTCGSCHTLAAAGTRGTIGPNLDNSFSAARVQGFKSSTIQQIVADQIRVPLQGVSCPKPAYQPTSGITNCAEGASVTPVGNTVMPANLVKGKDLLDVSAFVSRCAGATDAGCGSGGQITSTDGKQIFLTAGCTSCHTLKDAGSTGTVGPNLDQAKPPESRVVDRVTNGKGVMPSFKSKLSTAQIHAVAKYVSSVAGK